MRTKIYDNWSMPRGVEKIAQSICADYGRRSVSIHEGRLPENVIAEYMRLNSVIDTALSNIEEARVYRQILKDICEGHGYDKSDVQFFMCENSYYARKRMLIFLVAERLNLL